MPHGDDVRTALSPQVQPEPVLNLRLWNLHP